MGVVGRFWNFVAGLFWQGQRSLEKANPEAVYEMAIRKMKLNYQHMHAAVGRLAAERNRLRALIDKKTQQLAAVEQDLEAALAEAAAGDTSAEELGEDMIREKTALEGELGAVRMELTKSEALVGDYLGKLRRLEGQTKELESRRDAMIAKLQSAQARKAFADMVSGMSTSAEEAAVGDIEKHIEGLAAQADIADEMSGETREQKRAKLRQASTTRAAKSQFQQMLEARQAGAGGTARPVTVKAQEGKGGL